MKKYMPILKMSRIFSGLSEDEISSMSGCLNAKVQSFEKGEYIFRQGEYINNITLVAEGSIHIQNDDYWGNRTIVNVVPVGDMFGEAYTAPDSGALLNDVVAASDCTVIFFDTQKLMTTCPTACRFHSAVIQNLFFAISDKIWKLVRKIGIISRRSTREKLMTYLSEQAKKHKSGTFEIPFNRQQLADFLSVDRSAMSAELCRMRDEGLLKFERNKFILLQE